MKNCDEMVKSLFERREEYVAEQRKKRKAVICTAASLCCVCIVALSGFGVWKSVVSDNSPEQTMQDALYPGIKDNFDENKGESPDNPAANNKIIVNQIDDISVDKHNICLLVDDFVSMDKDGLNEYYGVNIFPDVPGDMEEWEEQKEHFGIYRRDGGTGDVYWDTQVLNYSNKDFSKTVNVTVDKGEFPLCDYMLFEETEEKSIINNLEVAIGYSAGGQYYAQFMHKNVGFQISAEGLSEEEFTAVISSLIK